MSEFHDENGKFKKGNNAASLQKTTSLMKQMKGEVKEEFYKSIHDLFFTPWTNLKQEVENKDCTKWRYLLAHAVNKKKHDFVLKCIEHMIGRPKENDKTDVEALQILINGLKSRD